MDAQGRPSNRSTLTRLLFEPDFRRRAIRYALGRPAELETQDRHDLERIILPYYTSRPELNSFLFIGVAWYTRHYPKQVFAGKTLWTVDLDPVARKHGAKQHLTASVTELAQHFAPASFDCVIMNGVYGHGLSEKDACEHAFAACNAVLRPGGEFLFGWNDRPEYRGADLAEIESLRAFEPVVMPAFGVHRYPSDPVTQHVYQFFRKPLSA